ncbi:phosphate/phosphite/phosphonate ABC transporter substrate-binding protein [sulfur-oxidizing endosymbiont of Gigantopelta aegis]|uniref:phosphate/phosphite/phosphonate ABC transporter substrate-binding protein n=1 Tax=sulfur-oxidizing endosymbiont of Gigantopelta aegis TaxID=2794934 RepID=UPI0018DB9521|nr:PhnD/SsuA/transferrin family substrate-binding protein [sulfur-oxidizing endosymbiont of Gigantopelta aegis]
MSFNLTISPDFKPELISGWYIFNTWLQKQINVPIHINMVNDFQELSQAIDSDSIDLIYANPCDIARLIREKSFSPVVKPLGSHDETVIISKIGSPITKIEDLSSGLKVALTDVPDVNTMGMIMLEPADISPDDIVSLPCSNYITVAKKVINGEADVGFLLADAYGEFSKLVKNQTHALITSQIHVLHHALLAGPKFSEHFESLQQTLSNMHNEPSGVSILKNLELDKWQVMDHDEAEFLIDLIDTLST